MQLTRGSEYAIRAVLDLAMKSKTAKAQLKDIALRMEIPEDFLAKIFQILNRSGIVKSYRGTKGGYALAKDAEQINLKDVITAVDGPIKLNKCINSDCTVEGVCKYILSCPVHDIWQEAQESFINILDNANFKKLADNLAAKTARA